MQFILPVTRVREFWTLLCRTRFRTCQDAVCKSTDRLQAKPAAVSADMAARGGSDIVTNLLASESWLHCLIQAYQIHPVCTLHVCVCVCVNGWFSSRCQLGRFFWRTRSYKLYVLCHFCHGIDSVHRVPAWSSDMWWTLVAKLMSDRDRA